jgi:DNA polymerase elongation subunit (family B)
VTLASDLAALESGEPRVLTLDIETSPNVVYAWGLWDQNISTTQVIEHSRVLCFAAKWLDEAEVIFHSEHHGSRADMIAAAWQLLDEADWLITYNGPAFDVKHLQREFVLAGYGPPSPWQDIDLLKVVRANFKFASNKLGHITDRLGLDTKLETGGQQLWNAVLQGDEAAWQLFRAYCETDVLITEQLYARLQHWVKGPHRGLWSGELSACPACDSLNLIPAGTAYSRTNAWPRLRCEDCGALSRMLRNGRTRHA